MPEDVVNKFQMLQVNSKKRYIKGWAACSVCGERVGVIECSYKGWKWPSGLLHYVLYHNVHFSCEFEDFIEENE